MRIVMMNEEVLDNTLIEEQELIHNDSNSEEVNLNDYVNRSCAITTFDNPFNPFEDFDSWLMYDKEKGYDSCERLARIAQIEDDFTQKEIIDEIERAIDRIIELDPFNIYKKIVKNN